MRNFHVAIVGGGVIGSAIAWELSNYELNVVVFESGSDVCNGASKANSGVVHSGINSPSGSKKLRFCINGNRMIQTLANKMDFSLKGVGKYIIAKNEDEIKVLEHLKKTGIKNDIPGLEIHDKSFVKLREPNVSCVAGLWVPTAGILSPYEFTISLAENATINGVKFLLKTTVLDINKQNNNFLIKTNSGYYQSKVLINAAGLNCRKILSFLENPDFNIYPCRGQYLVLDKNYSDMLNSMIYPVPIHDKGVLGIHITPTIEGNILIGPSAEFIDNPDDTATTKEVMELLIKEANEILPIIPKNQFIKAYSGIRCKIASPEERGLGDYRIEASKNTLGLINLIGIESPGLTSAPAIAKEIKKMVTHFLILKNKNKIKLERRKKRFYEMTKVEQSNKIKEDNRWGKIVCRCEHITEAEVINALSNPLGAQTLTSVKNRCRAGMGRCQGGFCMQHIIRIMEKEFNQKVNDITNDLPGSYLFTGRTREIEHD